MSKKKERKYAHIWQALKDTQGQKLSYVTLEFPKEIHKTVLLALRKECINDRAFRAECIEKGKSFEIGFNQIGDVLQLYLRWKEHITDSFVIGPERIARMSKWRK